MPFVHVQTSVPVAEPAREQLLAELSTLTAKTMGKPEQYVMVSLSQTALCMGGRPGPAAFCDVRSIGGLNPEVCTLLSAGIGGLLHVRLKVPTDRVYLTFTDVEADHWGWNLETFG